MELKAGPPRVPEFQVDWFQRAIVSEKGLSGDAAPPSGGVARRVGDVVWEVPTDAAAVGDRSPLAETPPPAVPRRADHSRTSVPDGHSLTPPVPAPERRVPTLFPVIDALSRIVLTLSPTVPASADRRETSASQRPASVRKRRTLSPTVATSPPGLPHLVPAEWRQAENVPNHPHGRGIVPTGAE